MVEILTAVGIEISLIFKWILYVFKLSIQSLIMKNSQMLEINEVMCRP